MAAIPKRGAAAEAALLGKGFTKETVAQAKIALATDFQPMTDVRASDKYRMTVAQNLIEKCYVELQSTFTSNVIETRVVNN